MKRILFKLYDTWLILINSGTIPECVVGRAGICAQLISMTNSISQSLESVDVSRGRWFKRWRRFSLHCAAVFFEMKNIERIITCNLLVVLWIRS